MEWLRVGRFHQERRAIKESGTGAPALAFPSGLSTTPPRFTAPRDGDMANSFTTTIVRRSLGITAAAAAPAFVLASFGVHARIRGGQLSLLGALLFAMGLALGALNFYLSVVRPLTAQKKELRHISGVPLLGMIALPGLALLPHWVSSLAALQLLLDTGNITWFVVATWRDASLWGSLR